MWFLIAVMQHVGHVATHIMEMQKIENYINAIDVEKKKDHTIQIYHQLSRNRSTKIILKSLNFYRFL